MRPAFCVVRASVGAGPRAWECCADAGASEAELAETAWVASAIRAGGAYAHGRLAFKLAEGHQH